jgi:hypothetical protein
MKTKLVFATTSLVFFASLASLASTETASSAVKVSPLKVLTNQEAKAIEDAALGILRHGARAAETIDREGKEGKAAAEAQLAKAKQLLNMIDKAVTPVKAESKITLGGETYTNTEEYKPNLIPIADYLSEVDFYSVAKGKEKLDERVQVDRMFYLDRALAKYELNAAETALAKGELQQAKDHMRVLSRSIVESFQETFNKSPEKTTKR